MNSKLEQSITLDFLREDGKHEITKLVYYSLGMARNMADSVFRTTKVRYVEVVIRTDDGYSEKFSNLYAASITDLQRI